jgi:hypothetical protein
MKKKDRVYRLTRKRGWANKTPRHEQEDSQMTILALTWNCNQKMTYEDAKRNDFDEDNDDLSVRNAYILDCAIHKEETVVSSHASILLMMACEVLRPEAIENGWSH